MRLFALRLPIALVLTSLALVSCTHRGEMPLNSALKEDDDTFCRAGGTVAPGSPQYVACIRDRDAQRANEIARADRKQRDLGEYMLTKPVHP